MALPFVPAFGPVPGGPELLVIFLVVLLVFGPVVAAVVFALRYARNRGERSDRVTELEDRVAELEREREQWFDGDSGADAGERDGGVEARDAASAEEAVEDWEGERARGDDGRGDDASRE